MLKPLLRSPLSPLLRASAASIGFTPYVLFVGGQQGAWYEPSSAIATPWYQDSAATTPITAAEQPIGNERDKSGNANHAIQATAAARPVLKQDAGYYSAFFDGIDDSLSSATGGGGTAGFFWCGGIKPTGGAGTSRVIFSDITANNGYHFAVIGAGNVPTFYAGNGIGFNIVGSVGLSIDQLVIVSAWDDGINLSIQINNGAIESLARPSVTAGTARFTIGKHNDAAADFFLGNIYAHIYVKNSGLTVAQRALVKNYVAQQAGIVL